MKDISSMAQTADPARLAYLPPNSYQAYPQSPPLRHSMEIDQNRSSHPLPPQQDSNRQEQYPPLPLPYQPPGQWARQSQGQSHQHTGPHNQPGQPLTHLDCRPLPVYPQYHGPPRQQPRPAPAPWQRTAIACKYCRKRKIRCSGHDTSPEGRCKNCVRLNQQCLFYPVWSQTAFVLASAYHYPKVLAAAAGQDGQPGQSSRHQPMLYGADGTPLNPTGSGGQPQYNYPPPPSHLQESRLSPPHLGYPPASYHIYPATPLNHAQGPAPANAIAYQHESFPTVATTDSSEREDLTRGPLDDEGLENSGVNHSLHPNSKVGYGSHHRCPNDKFEYQNATSPANSKMSYQFYPPQSYNNGVQPVRGNISSLIGSIPSSIQSPNSPHSVTVDNQTPPAIMQFGLAGSSRKGRSDLKIHEMLGTPNHAYHGCEQRIRSDNDMLSKLDGKK